MGFLHSVSATTCKRTLAGVIPAVLLGACGGGSSAPASSTAATQSAAVPMQTAIAQEVDNGVQASVTVSGTIDNTPVTGTGTVDDTPAAATKFQNLAMLETTDTVSDTVVDNGTTVTMTETTQVLVNPSTFAEVAETRSDGSVVVFPPYTYPPTVVPGDSGTLATGTHYSDESQTDVTGSVDLTYDVMPDTSTSDLVVVDETDTNNNNVQTRDEETTYRVDDDGHPDLVSKKDKETSKGHKDNLDDENENNNGNGNNNGNNNGKGNGKGNGNGNGNGKQNQS
jgi:hypothetical protein